MPKEDFDKLSKQLEAIVEELERGEIDLSEALEKFKKGSKLVEKLEAMLKETQQQVEVLSKELEGKTDVE